MMTHSTGHSQAFQLCNKRKIGLDDACRSLRKHESGLVYSGERFCSCKLCLVYSSEKLRRRHESDLVCGSTNRLNYATKTLNII